MSETKRIDAEQRLVLAAAGVGTWRYDISTDRFTGDDLTRQLLGLDPTSESFCQDDVLRGVHELSVSAVRQFFNGVHDTQHTRSVAFPTRDSRTKSQFLTARTRLVTDAGAAGQLVGVVIDDTESQLLQRNLRRNENWLQTLVEGVPQSFMYMDSQQRVLFANAVFLRNTGWVGKDVRGRHLSEIHGREFYDSRVAFIEKALRGETVSYEAIGKKGDVTGFFHHEFKPNFDLNGKVVGIFATATDISERRRFEQEIEEKQEELVQSNQDLEQFAYVASHDLKAPLRAIHVLVDWLREDLEDYDDGDVQENLDLLAQRTGRLGQLLDDLLAYSRVGRKVGDVVEVDCRRLVKDLVDLMGVPEHIAVEIHGDLPVFETHLAPLEQVFRNLIGNAVKHHPGREGKILVSCEIEDEFYVFAVADDGEGIPPEYSDRVFKMFQTLKPRDEVEGSGMGLAIVSRIVERQGGRVWFESAPQGIGTVFRFQWQRFVSGRDSELPLEEEACRQAAK